MTEMYTAPVERALQEEKEITPVLNDNYTYDCRRTTKIGWFAANLANSKKQKMMAINGTEIIETELLLVIKPQVQLLLRVKGFLGQTWERKV